MFSYRLFAVFLTITITAVNGQDLQCTNRGGYPDIQVRQFKFSPWNESLPIEQQTSLPTVEFISPTQLQLTTAWSAVVTLHNRNCGQATVQSINGQGFLADPVTEQPMAEITTKFTQSDFTITPQPKIELRLAVDLDFTIPLGSAQCQEPYNVATTMRTLSTIAMLLECEYQAYGGNKSINGLAAGTSSLVKLQFARNLLRPTCFFSSYTTGQTSLPDDSNLIVYTTIIEIGRIMNMLSIKPTFSQRLVMICPR